MFFASPNGVAMSMAKELIENNVRIIDISADFRIPDVDTWEKWYKAIATTVVKSIKKEGDIYRWDASGRGGVGPAGAVCASCPILYRNTN